MEDPVRVTTDDWPALVEHLREFAGADRVETADDRVAASFVSAEFAVARDGGVAARMPLHEFAADAADALAFDHDEGEVRVETDGVTYEFRRPST